jgi:hypothetical protein
MTEKASGNMSVIEVNWQNEIGVIAGPYDGNRKGWLSRAARRANVTYRTVKALYYGESTNPRHSVAASILSAAELARIEDARRDASEIAQIYYRRAETLAAIDEDFHRTEIDALIEAARILGGGDSTGANRGGGVK